MPALPPIPNCLKATLQYAYGDDNNAQNILHFSYSGGPPSATDCATLAGDIRASFNTNLKSLFHTGSVLETTTVLDLGSSTGAQGVDTTTVTGTEAGAGLAAATCALINFGIAQRYRGGKGRAYFPGFTNSDLATLGHWLPASITAMGTGWTNFIAAIVGAVAGTTTITHHVIASQYSGYNAPTIAANNRAKNHPKLRAGGPTMYNVTSWTCNAKPGTQRRRYVR
jgi:hypothetical protein